MYLMPILTLALAAALPAAAPPPWASAVAEVERLARSGTPDLALARLDRLQPAAGVDAEAWAAWQRLRLDILQTRKDWKALVAATAVLPSVTSDVGLASDPQPIDAMPIAPG